MTAGVLAGGILVVQARGKHSGTAAGLAALLPVDLDALESPTIIGALGVQLLLFGGFEPGALGWQRATYPPTSLQDRVDRIAPTWKRGGRIEYSWPGTASTSTSTPAALALFDAASSSPLAVPGAGHTVRSLSRALERLGLDAADFDAPARAALREMLTWRLPPAAARVPLEERADLTLLVLSFDATPECRAVDDCPRRGWLREEPRQQRAISLPGGFQGLRLSLAAHHAAPRSASDPRILPPFNAEQAARPHQRASGGDGRRLRP